MSFVSEAEAVLDRCTSFPPNLIGRQSAPDISDSIDALLRDISGDSQRVTELQGEVDNLRAEMHRRQGLEAFNKYASDLQGKLPETLPSDWARTSLIAAAAQDPNLEAAWRYRNLTEADRRQPIWNFGS